MKIYKYMCYTLPYSKYLADINNEREVKNTSYKKNLVKLEKFVMVKWLQDSVIVPRVSAHFGFFKLGQVGYDYI